MAMAAKQPRVGSAAISSPSPALAIGAPLLGNIRNPVEHQKRRQRQLGIARAKQFPSAAGDEILLFAIGTPLVHVRSTHLLPWHPFGLFRARFGRLLTHRPPRRKTS